MDIIDDDEEQCADKSTSITITGEEWWLKFLGLADELPWPEEEADDSSILQTYKNTPLLSLNVSITGKDTDETGCNKDQPGFGMTAEQPQSNRWDKRYMTNMVRANTDITGCDRETTWYTDT